VHISEVSKERIENIHDHLKVGQKVKVVVKGRDEKGRLGLSMKQVS
jgi:predicted RNA-binding protein with RPS1 domain